MFACKILVYEVCFRQSGSDLQFIDRFFSIGGRFSSIRGSVLCNSIGILVFFNLESSLGPIWDLFCNRFLEGNAFSLGFIEIDDLELFCYRIGVYIASIY